MVDGKNGIHACGKISRVYQSDILDQRDWIGQNGENVKIVNKQEKEMCSQYSHNSTLSIFYIILNIFKIQF